MQEHDKPPEGGLRAASAGPLTAVRTPRAGDRVIYLNAPFTIGSTRIRRVIISPLTFGDEQDLTDAPRGALLAAMTGLSDLDLRRLRGTDVDAVLSTALDLLPARLREALDA